MTQILGIMGSPRREGNTHILVSRMLDSAARAGASVDMVSLGGMQIRQCDGCHVCWKAGRCAKNDDMQALYPKIIESDVLVLGTPVYWYGPSAIMKLFIDRLVYFNCPETRKLVRGHRAVLVVPFEDTVMETADLLVAMIQKSLAYLEMEFVGHVLVPGVGERGDVLAKTEHLARCDEFGRQLAKGGA